MRVWCFAIGILLLLPTGGFSEVWEFSCTEAIALLKAAQEQVVQKHDQLQEAKFSLRHTPKIFDGCRKSRRGFQGGEIHCVTHQSKQGNLLKEILAAQRGLDASLLNFEKERENLPIACATPPP